MMEYPIKQEFRIFRALGLAFRSWFRNVLPFTLLAALLSAPIFYWIATSDLGQVESVEELLDRAFVWPMYGVVAMGALVSPLLTYRVIQDLNGERVSMLTSIRHGVRGVVPALIIAIVVNVLHMVPGGAIVGAIVICVWFVAAPAAVAERLGPGAALSRGAQLSSGRRWGIFGLTFLMGLLMIGLMLAWIMPMLNEPGEDFLATVRTTSLGFVGVMCLFQVFAGIVAAVSYALLRLDKDGVSHRDLAGVFD
jgi:hypothetical protein